jgi:dihydropteroate synthase
MDADTNAPRVWNYRGGSFELGRRTLLMGVVNITPDSFSDGGRFFSTDTAVEHTLRLQNESADLLDLGAESTRPGSEPVPVEEQLRRLLPVMEALQGRLRVPISIDTSSAIVARECLGAGAAIINDITGFRQDLKLPSVCHEFGAGIVLMHIKGKPKTMQHEPHYEDLLTEIRQYLAEGVEIAERTGISRDRVIIDPGLGFGKTFKQNYQLLGGLSWFHGLAAGVLVGPSRKAFTGEFSDLPADKRQFSTAAAVAVAMLNGADVIRVHDVAEIRQVTDILDRYITITEDELVASTGR